MGGGDVAGDNVGDFSLYVGDFSLYPKNTYKYQMLIKVGDFSLYVGDFSLYAGVFSS